MLGVPYQPALGAVVAPQRRFVIPRRQAGGRPREFLGHVCSCRFGHEALKKPAAAHIGLRVSRQPLAVRAEIGNRSIFAQNDHHAGSGLDERPKTRVASLSFGLPFALQEFCPIGVLNDRQVEIQQLVQ
jgi:hypothetical protein